MIQRALVARREARDRSKRDAGEDGARGLRRRLPRLPHRRPALPVAMGAKASIAGSGVRLDGYDPGQAGRARTRWRPTCSGCATPGPSPLAKLAPHAPRALRHRPGLLQRLARGSSARRSTSTSRTSSSRATSTAISTATSTSSARRSPVRRRRSGAAASAVPSRRAATPLKRIPRAQPDQHGHLLRRLRHGRRRQGQAALARREQVVEFACASQGLDAAALQQAFLATFAAHPALMAPAAVRMDLADIQGDILRAYGNDYDCTTYAFVRIRLRAASRRAPGSPGCSTTSRRPRPGRPARSR